MKKRVILVALVGVLGLCSALQATASWRSRQESCSHGAFICAASLLAAAISKQSMDVAIDRQLALVGACAAYEGVAGITTKVLPLLNEQGSDDVNCLFEKGRGTRFYHIVKDAVVDTGYYIGMPFFLHCAYNAISTKKISADLVVAAAKKCTHFMPAAGMFGAMWSTYIYCVVGRYYS